VAVLAGSAGKMRRASATLMESNQSITDILDIWIIPRFIISPDKFTAYFSVSPTQFRSKH
jgi:hypothetical protein